MAMVVQFPHTKASAPKMSEQRTNYNIFDELSKRVGVDLDKVVIHRDPEETKKMERTLAKETLKLRTKYFT